MNEVHAVRVDRPSFRVAPDLVSRLVEPLTPRTVQSPTEVDAVDHGIEVPSIIPRSFRDRAPRPVRGTGAPSWNRRASVALEDLVAGAKSDDDAVVERALVELARKDGECSRVEPEFRPGAGAAVYASYRSPKGYYLELVGDPERLVNGRAQGYRIVRPHGDAGQPAEWYERQFDASSRSSIFVDQKSLQHPGGVLQKTEVRRTDGAILTHVRTEKEVVTSYGGADAHFGRFSGYQRFASLVGDASDLEYTRICQETMRSERASPPASDSASRRGGNPLGRLLMELHLWTSDIPILPVDGVYEVLRSANGAALRLFSPVLGKRVLTVQNLRGDVVFWEEETDANDPSGRRYYVQTIVDREGRSKRRRIVRTRGQRQEYVEESHALFADGVDPGVEGRQTRFNAEVTRQISTGVEERTVQEWTPTHAERRRERRKGAEVTYEEHSIGIMAGASRVESIVRRHAGRESSGEEVVRGDGRQTERRMSFRVGGIPQMECTRSQVNDDRESISYVLPARQARGDILVCVDEAGCKTRRRRHEKPSVAPAARYVPEMCGELMATSGRTVHTVSRWEWMDESCWRLEEAVRSWQTSHGQVTDSVVEHVTRSGEWMSATTERRAPDQVRESFRRWLFCDRAPIARAVGTVFRGVRSRRGLLAYLPGHGICVERIHALHDASGLGAAICNYGAEGHPEVAVSRVELAGKSLWLLRGRDVLQALHEGTGNTAWAGRARGDGWQRVDLMVDLPHCGSGLQAELRETRLDRIDRDGLSGWLQGSGMPSWDELLEASPTVREFNSKIGSHDPLEAVLRTLEGADDVGLLGRGERLQLKTPSGDILVVLRRSPMGQALAYVCGADGREHLTVPHPQAPLALVLAGDASGLYGERLCVSSTRPDAHQCLGRLDDWSGGLLAWIRQGGTSPLCEDFMLPLRDYAQTLHHTHRFAGRDDSVAMDLLWDVSRLAWGDPRDASSVETQLLLASGFTALEIACLMLAGESRDLASDGTHLAPVRIPV